MMDRVIRLKWAVVVVLFTMLVVASVTSTTMLYQGRLTDTNGRSLTDVSSIRFSIYDAPENGNELWSEIHTDLALDPQGVFTAELGRLKPIPSSTFASGEAFLELIVDGQPLSPRQPFGAAPVAYTVSSHGAEPGQVLKWNGIAWVAEDAATGDAVTLSGDQDITGNKIYSGSNRFDGNVRFSGRSMIVDSNGIRIGDSLSPDDSRLIGIDREYSSDSIQIGLDVHLTNTGSGAIRGLNSYVKSIDEGGTASDRVTGVSGMAVSNGLRRWGVRGEAAALDASEAEGTSYGVEGWASYGKNAYGLYGYASSATNGYAVYGYAVRNVVDNWAGYFDGNVRVAGALAGGKSGIIMDHPLDPGNKFLHHNSMNSPDMLNVYTGNVVLDGEGEGTVSLPPYFEALNESFRYQLTAIGVAAPELHIAEKIDEGRFKIAGGQAGMEVSWQVTGLRRDPYAETNGSMVESYKPETERGKYLHPKAYGLGKEFGLHYETHRQAEGQQMGRLLDDIHRK